MSNKIRNSVRRIFDGYVAVLAALLVAGAAFQGDITMLLAGA